VTSAAPPHPRRILELDALRGIAALGVVFWHYGAHFHARPLAWLLQPFYNAGFLLVDFFFVLSGFVIAAAYWREPRQWRLADNLRARFARLYPLHLLTLLAVVALLAALPAGRAPDPDFAPATNDAKHLLLNLLLLNQVGLQDGWSFNTPAWSISAEWVINVLFLAWIALALRWRLVAAAVAATLGVAMIATSARPWIQGAHAFGWLDVDLLRCTLGFAAGVGLQRAMQHGGSAALLLRPRLANGLALLALVALVALLLASGRHPPVWHYLLSIAVAVACVALTPYGAIARTLLRHRALTWLGDVSYSVYLVHFPLQLALHALVARGMAPPDYGSPLVLAGYVAVVLGVSALTHRRVELPWQARLLGAPSRKRSLA